MLDKQLLPAIEKLHGQYRIEPAFSIQNSYDPLLPLNLLVRPLDELPNSAEPTLLTPSNVFDSQLAKDDYVRLEEFAIRKVDLQDDTVTLNLPIGQTNKSYTLRLNAVGKLSSYLVNQIILPIEGIVVETRDELLQAEVQRAMGDRLDLNRKTIRLADGTELPNPLKYIEELLSRFEKTKVGTIQGDLNLENILVYPETNTVSLIDFAAAREDDLLHDFLRLESEIVVKLVASSLAKGLLNAENIFSFYQKLHSVVALNIEIEAIDGVHPVLSKPFKTLVTIRRIAQRYLEATYQVEDQRAGEQKGNEWAQYYKRLILYMLGALKFKSLDEQASAPLPKQLAFLGAATLVGLLESSQTQPLPPSPPTELG